MIKEIIEKKMKQIVESKDSNYSKFRLLSRLKLEVEMFIYNSHLKDYLVDTIIQEMERL